MASSNRQAPGSGLDVHVKHQNENEDASAPGGISHQFELQFQLTDSELEEIWEIALQMTHNEYERSLDGNANGNEQLEITPRGRKTE